MSSNQDVSILPTPSIELLGTWNFRLSLELLLLYSLARTRGRLGDYFGNQDNRDDPRDEQQEQRATNDDENLHRATAASARATALRCAGRRCRNLRIVVLQWRANGVRIDKCIRVAHARIRHSGRGATTGSRRKVTARVVVVVIPSIRLGRC